MKNYAAQLSKEDLFVEAFEEWVDGKAIKMISEVPVVYEKNLIVKNLVDNYVNAKHAFKEYRRRVLAGKMPVDDVLYTNAEAIYRSYKTVMYETVVTLYKQYE